MWHAVVQNLLSISLWSTLRSIFIALLAIVGVFDLVRLLPYVPMLAAGTALRQALAIL
jgi:hypothetical protein